MLIRRKNLTGCFKKVMELTQMIVKNPENKGLRIKRRKALKYGLHPID